MHLYFVGIISSLTILNNVAAVVLRLEQGLLLGEKKWTITGDRMYYSFKGIPYAAPPVGDLRFKAPQPPQPWIGIRNATAHGNICPQFDILNTNTVIPGSEDCLFLNVYTPNLKPPYLLPIIFFIHGGGFIEGSGNDDLYGPDFLINQNDVIVVTINYRLNILGFITLDSEEAPGNAGLKDQVAALRWVRRNIRNFGGDPERVTIFGESAGGSSCTLHALSQMSRGLFRRVIVTSGVPVSLFTVAFDHEQKRRPFVLAKKLGFRTTDTSELLRFLRTVPVERLININDSIVAGEDYISFFGKTYYVPVVEKDFGQERFIAEPPLLSVGKGLSDVDLLLGHNSEEGLLAVRYLENSSIIADYDRYPEVLVPRDVYYRTTPQMHLELADSIREYYTGSRLMSLTTIPVFVSYITDLFIYPVLRYARRLTNAPRNGDVYLFQFSSLTERNVESRPGLKYRIIGVSHLDDLEYVFQANKYNLPVDKRALSYKIIQQICALYTNFAIFGNPTPDSSLGVMWPTYNRQTEIYLNIGQGTLTLHSNPRPTTMRFWESIYELAGLQF